MKILNILTCLALLLLFLTSCSQNQPVTPADTIIGIRPEPPAQNTLNTPQPADPGPQGNAP